MHTAVIFNHLNILKYLLDLKLDVNFRDLYDHTPLDYSKYPEITSALESRGAVRSGKPIDFEINENQKLLDEEHQKLFWAAYFGDIDLMQFYLIHGCNIRQTSYDGKTILDVAIMRKNLAATKFIVNHWPQREELIPVVEDYMKKLTAPEYQPIKDYLEDACYEDDEF